MGEQATTTAKANAGVLRCAQNDKGKDGDQGQESRAEARLSAAWLRLFVS
jgi:hypothetical protein